MKLKVCGMRENENILALSDLRPDYIGFIFWASSSRYVNSPTPKLDKKIKKTGAVSYTHLTLPTNREV